MNQENIVKVGVALKWRGTYDNEKRYYQENLATMYGSIFRLKALTAVGVPPMAECDSDGHMGFINEDYWDVVLDMSAYYNHALDSYLFALQTFQYIKRLDKLVADHQRSIINVNARMDSEELRMSAIETQAQTQQIEISANKQACEQRDAAIQLALDALTGRVDAYQSKDDDLQAQITEQRNRIEALYDWTTTYEDDLWDNSALWDNEKLWVNFSFANSFMQLNTVIVQDYDAATQTVTLK